VDGLQQMYQQVILDHAKKPHGRVSALGTVEGGQVGSAAIVHAEAHSGLAKAESHQVNPTCGDEITLEIQVNDGKVQELSWQGQGCSISQASASVMTDIVTGESLTEAKRAEQLFHQLMNSRGKGLADEAAEEVLGDAVAFTGTSQYPARIKCALLGWMALRDAISKVENVESND